MSAGKVIVFFDHGYYMGHFLPTLAVAKLMVSQGHTVYYFASESVRSHIESTGAIFQPYDLAKHKQGVVWKPEEVAVEQVTNMGYTAPAEMRKSQQFYTMLPVSLSLLQNGLVSRVQKLKPDVIFADQFIVWAHMVAEILRVPLVYSYSAAYIDPKDFYETYGLAPVVKPIAEQECMVAVTETLTTQFGLDYTVYNMFEKNPGYILCYTTPEFDQGCADADPAVVHCAGPSFPRLEYDYDRLDNTADINDAIFLEDLKGFPLQRLTERKEAGDTIIYCSMGTIAAKYKYTDTAPLFRTLVKLYGNKPNVMVVCALGELDAAELPAMPANFLWQKSLPQKSVLGIADVFLSHMGNNSTNEALFMGCPIVSIPLFADQTRNAARVENLGLGVHIPNPNAPTFAPALDYITQERLGAAVDQVLNDPSYKQRCQAMKTRMRRQHLYFHRHGVQDILDYARDQHLIREGSKPTGRNDTVDSEIMRAQRTCSAEHENVLLSTSRSGAGSLGATVERSR